MNDVTVIDEWQQQQRSASADNASLDGAASCTNNVHTLHASEPDSEGHRDNLIMDADAAEVCIKHIHVPPLTLLHDEANSNGYHPGMPSSSSSTNNPMYQRGVADAAGAAPQPPLNQNWNRKVDYSELSVPLPATARELQIKLAPYIGSKAPNITRDRALGMFTHFDELFEHKR